MSELQHVQPKWLPNWRNWKKNAIKCTNPEEFRKIVQQAIQTINLENYEWWALISFNSPELVA